MAYTPKEKKADGFAQINLDQAPDNVRKAAAEAMTQLARFNEAKKGFEAAYLATPRAKAKGLTAENTAFGYRYGKPSVKLVAPRGSSSGEDSGF